MTAPERVLPEAKAFIRKALERIEADPIAARLDCLSAVAVLDTSPDLTKRPIPDKCTVRKGEMIPLRLGDRRKR